MTEDNISFGRLVPMLTTDDLDATIAFYRDTLGFELLATYPEDNPNWCYLRRGGSHLMFSSLDQLDHGPRRARQPRRRAKSTTTTARPACGRSTSTRTTSSPSGRG